MLHSCTRILRYVYSKVLKDTLGKGCMCCQTQLIPCTFLKILAMTHIALHYASINCKNQLNRQCERGGGLWGVSKPENPEENSEKPENPDKILAKPGNPQTENQKSRKLHWVTIIIHCQTVGIIVFYLFCFTSFISLPTTNANA